MASSCSPKKIPLRFSASFCSVCRQGFYTSKSEDDIVVEKVDNRQRFSLQNIQLSRQSEIFLMGYVLLFTEKFLFF